MSGPTEVPDVVVALAAALRAILGDRLVAVYLGGSFSMDDFVDGISDYDILVVTAAELSRRPGACPSGPARYLACRYGSERCTHRGFS